MQTQVLTDNIAYFLAFCLESHKNAHHLSGEQAANIFVKNHVMDFLTESYDVLHTQSPGWIQAEIDDYINSYSK